MTDSAQAPLFDFAGKRVYVAGHTGMVGAAIVRRLKSERCTILTVDRAHARPHPPSGDRAMDPRRQAPTR